VDTVASLAARQGSRRAMGTVASAAVVGVKVQPATETLLIAPFEIAMSNADALAGTTSHAKSANPASVRSLLAAT
jgi:hypothetical protein